MLRVVLSACAAVAVATTVATCATGRDSRSQVRFRKVVAGMDSPLYVAAPRAERDKIYAVEQDGRIYQLPLTRRRPELRAATVFLDIRRLVTSGGEQGLLSVAFHPDYARNHKFYVDYTDRRGDTRVVEYRSNGTRAIPSSRRQLLFVDQPFSNHNGGQLEFGPDGRLYVGMGDGGSAGDPGNRAQSLRSKLGKLLSLNVNRRGAKWQMRAYGLRNPWRFSWDPATKNLYIGDVGQGDWEEIDVRSPRGQRTLTNYGWSAYEGRARFEPRRLNPRGKLVFPVLAYGHSRGCSVTGGYVYRGSAVPAARGRYFYGDFCSGTIWSFRYSRGKARDNRREGNISGLSSFGEDANGELYAVSLEGSIFKLAR